MSAQPLKFRWRRVTHEQIPEDVVVLVWDREHRRPTFAVRTDGYLLDADTNGLLWDKSTWWAKVPLPPGEAEEN